MTPADQHAAHMRAILGVVRSVGIWIVPPQTIWRRALVAVRLLPPPSMHLIQFEMDIETGRFVADIPDGSKIVRVSV